MFYFEKIYKLYLTKKIYIVKIKLNKIVHYLQNFVDSGDLIENGLSALNSTELYKMQQIMSQFVVKTEIRGI